MTIAYSVKDHDTCLALAQVVMLFKDVADHTKEGLKEIRDQLVMQQVQVSITISITFPFDIFIFGYLSFFCFCFVESLESYHHLVVNERAILRDQKVQKKDKIYGEIGLELRDY